MRQAEVTSLIRWVRVDLGQTSIALCPCERWLRVRDEPPGSPYETPCTISKDLCGEKKMDSVCHAVRETLILHVHHHWY